MTKHNFRVGQVVYDMQHLRYVKIAALDHPNEGVASVISPHFVEDTQTWTVGTESAAYCWLRPLNVEERGEIPEDERHRSDREWSAFNASLTGAERNLLEVYWTDTAQGPTENGVFQDPSHEFRHWAMRGKGAEALARFRNRSEH
jgi:hypothetical protein